MIKNTLESLGLSPSEIKIYLHLLKEPSYAGKLSSKTGINRTNVYEALDRLLEKGIISFITKNRVRWYESKNPDSLKDIITEEKNKLKKLKKDVDETIETLQSLNVTNKSLEASIFVGKKGLRMLFEEILEAKKPISLIAAELQIKEVFGPYFELWHKERIAKKIKQQSIFPKKLKTIVKKRKLLQYKFVKNEFSNPTTTIMFGKVLLLIQWGSEPLAIRIENEALAKSHQNYFDQLWITSAKASSSD